MTAKAVNFLEKNPLTFMIHAFWDVIQCRWVISDVSKVVVYKSREVLED
jgi:hypothetical protein